jgi:F0F1-type ATP synthase epsilon subunit
LIEETDRVNKAKEKKRLDEAKREERQKKEDVARAERELQRATQRLNDLKTK